MKHKLPALALFVLLAQAGFAQFSAGVKVGANVMKVDGKSFNDQFNYGYHAGGFATIGLGGKLAIQPEVLFNQYQTKTDTSFKNIYQNAISGTRGVKLNYLSIPVLVNYKLASFFSLQAGPMFSVLMDRNKNLLENGKDAFRQGDLSVLGGAQVNVRKFRVSGRYMVGLNNINDIDNKDKWRNQGFQVSVGLAL